MGAPAMTTPAPGNLAWFKELMTEAEVCDRFPNLISEAELLIARRNGQIKFTKGKKGVILYHPDDFATYLQRKVTQCPQRQDSGSTMSIGSLASRIPISSTPAGTTSERDALVAEHLAQKFSARRKSG
jgi:hypothetical protein